MEITPEIYAWFVNLNIINGAKTMKMTKEGNIVLSDKITQELIDGLVIEELLRNLEEQYNKFYKLNLNYTKILGNMNKEARSNSIRYHNWGLLGEVLNNFGIDFTKAQIGEVSSGNRQALLQTLKSIYALSFELTR